MLNNRSGQRLKLNCHANIKLRTSGDLPDPLHHECDVCIDSRPIVFAAFAPGWPMGDDAGLDPLAPHLA